MPARTGVAGAVVFADVAEVSLIRRATGNEMCEVTLQYQDVVEVSLIRQAAGAGRIL